MTSRRGPSTINLVKRVSREEEPALLQVPLGSLVSLAAAGAAASEVSLVVAGAHSPEVEGRSLSTHPASGTGLVEADSTHRTQTRFLSEYFVDSGRVTK